MARPTKTGIDYFSMDTDFINDIKVRRILRSCGANSIAILICILGSIYREEGYYITWNADTVFYVADILGIEESDVINTVEKAIEVDFFSEFMYTSYSILTSKGIQKRYLMATERRKNMSMNNHYCLHNDNNNLVNVCNNPVNVDNNPVNVYKSTQSKVKESKVNNINIYSANDHEQKQKKSNEDVISESCRRIWAAYPLKKGKSHAITAIKSLLKKYKEQAILDAIVVYVNDVEKQRKDGFKDLQFKNGSTFFRSGIHDYLGGENNAVAKRENGDDTSQSISEEVKRYYDNAEEL